MSGILVDGCSLQFRTRGETWSRFSVSGQALLISVQDDTFRLWSGLQFMVSKKVAVFILSFHSFFLLSGYVLYSGIAYWGSLAVLVRTFNLVHNIQLPNHTLCAPEGGLEICFTRRRGTVLRV